MKRILLLTLLTLVATSFPACRCDVGRKPLRGVIITGQNNHNWPVCHSALRLTLENSGLFAMDVAVSPAAGEDMSSFNVDFDSYRFVVLDYNGDPWPEAMREAFLAYVRGGGGVLVIHAADNAFGDWEEYNRIIALGGWGGRDERSGPYVYWQDGGLVKDTTPGPGGSHGKRHAFALTRRTDSHPVVKGLPAKWMHSEDELYDRLRGPGNIKDLLYSAWSPSGPVTRLLKTIDEQGIDGRTGQDLGWNMLNLFGGVSVTSGTAPPVDTRKEAPTDIHFCVTVCVPHQCTQKIP